MSNKPPIEERIRTGIQAWLASNQDPKHLPLDWEFLVQYCWIFGPGEKLGLPDGAQDYARAARNNYGSNYDDLLAQRGGCGRCGQRFKVENMMVCTECFNTVCGACARKDMQDKQQLPKCGCGGCLVG